MPEEACLFATNVHACLTAQALNSKEREFLHSLLTWRSTSTPKQMVWLTRGYESLP
jgi:hypothetical protein